MDSAQIRRDDRSLLAAIQAFVADHRDPAMACFKPDVAEWGTERVEVAPAALPAARILTQALAHGSRQTDALAAAFARASATRKWEQTYTRADRAVGADMLSGYGFAEVIGKTGPFLSTRLRAGIGVWGPGIDYPAHRHGPEEIYVPLAGEAIFRLGEEGGEETHGPGSTVHVPSMQVHGFRTAAQPFAVFYLWRGGDMREKSTFEALAPGA